MDGENRYADYYSKIYRSGLQGWGSRQIDRQLLRHLVGLNLGVVLELGGGSGEFLDYARQRVSFLQWSVLDLYPKVSNPELAGLLEMVPGVRFIEGNVERLPMGDESVDTLISPCLFAHLDFPEEALQEIVRVLRPGGTAVIAFPTDPGFANRLVKIFVTYPKMRKNGLRPQLEYARAHRNSVANLLELVRAQFRGYSVKLRYWPLPLVPLLGANLLVTVKLQK